jgi:hypothetical protein
MALERFHFTTDSDVKIELPNFPDMRGFGKLVREGANLEDTAVVFDLIKKNTTQEVIDVIDDFSANELNRFFTAFGGSGEPTAGE